MRTVFSVFVVGNLFWSVQTHASEDASVFHIPPSSWEAGVPQRLSAFIENDWELDGVWVDYRLVGSDDAFERVEMLRAPSNQFVAVVPAVDVQPPGVEYFIVSNRADGAEEHRFAGPDSPYVINVSGETDETHLADRLARHRGHRSELVISGAFVQHGRRQVDEEDGLGRGETAFTDRGGDRYWVTRAEYTYRFLRVLYDIHFGLGVMRGAGSTVTVDGATRPLGSGTGEPGLNWGHGGITLEVARGFSVETDLIFGATEEGFAAGFGWLLRVGRIAATNLEVGGEHISHSGNTGFFRFSWDTIPRVPMGIAVEVSDWPNSDANPLGMRLVYELGWQVNDHLRLDTRGGYVARTDGIEGGPLVGLGVAASF